MKFINKCPACGKIDVLIVKGRFVVCSNCDCFFMKHSGLCLDFENMGLSLSI